MGCAQQRSKAAVERTRAPQRAARPSVADSCPTQRLSLTLCVENVCDDSLQCCTSQSARSAQTLVAQIVVAVLRAKWQARVFQSKELSVRHAKVPHTRHSCNRAH